MAGQLNLTGSGGGATQLVANDTITEDQEFVFPDTGGTVVTDDFDGDVEIDGDVTVDGAVETGTFIATRGDSARTPVISTSVAGNVVIGDASQIVLANGGDITADGAIQSGGSPYDGANVGCVIEDGGFAACKEDGGSVLWAGYTEGSNTQTSRILANGSATFANTFFSLDPDDPTKVLDVKESIRNIQSALYRLKAAVLIPDTTVDQLRLRILEALETITEEVD